MIDKCKETTGTNNSKDSITGEQMLQVNQENFIRTFLKKIIEKEDDDKTEEIQEHDNQKKEIQMSIDIENNQIAVLYKKKLYFSDIKPKDQDATIDRAIEEATEIKGLQDENSVNMMNIYLKNGLIYMPYEKIRLAAGARAVTESGQLRIVSPKYKEVISLIQFPPKNGNIYHSKSGVHCCFVCFNDKKNNFVDMSYNLSTTEYDKLLKVYFDKCLLNQKLKSGLNNEYNNENMNINNSNGEGKNLDDSNKKKYNSKD